MKRKISIFGLGYVGTVLLGCLAREGHNIIGVDIDPVKQNLLRQGQSPIIEEGMQELIAQAMDSGRVEITDDAEYAIHHSDISFTCVGTPSMPNGSQNMGAMKRLAEQFGKAAKTISDHHIFVIRSTVIPGTVEETIKPIIEDHSGKKTGQHFGLCFQPEFLREGSSIKDYYNPPYTVVGGDSQDSISVVRKVFDHLSCDFIETSIRSAEMIKYCCNVFHALKITFANEIGRICQPLGVDSHEVMRIVCQDTQLNISPAYMKPGFAFGGSCLPKDLKGLLYTAQRRDIRIPMLSHILSSNQIHIDHAVEMILSRGIKSVAMVGLSFKGGTDDLRESPLVVMAEKFIGKGLNLRIYDLKVNLSRLIGANRDYIEKTIPHIASLMSESCEEIINESQAIIIGQNDKPFMEKLYSICRNDHFILDLVGTVDRKRITGKYHGVCW